MTRYNTSNGTSRQPPRSIPRIINCPLSTLKFYVKTLHKSLGKKMRRANLKSPTITHHGFKCIGCICSSKFFTITFYSSYTLNGHEFIKCLNINIMKNRKRKLVRLITSLMERMSFLPMKFCASQKGAGTLLPSKYIYPLVIQKREITIGVESIFEKITKHKFRCWTNSQRIFQCLSSTNRYNRKLWRESFYMIFLSLKKTHGNKHGQKEILHPE